MQASLSGRDFRRAVVHIGEEIKKAFDESGLTKKAFAQKIGRGHNKINDVFESASLDSLLLDKVCEVLHVDFFAFYRKAKPKAYGDGAIPSIVLSEPQPQPVSTPKPPAIQLLVNIDPDDPELEKKVRQLTRILNGK